MSLSILYPRYFFSIHPGTRETFVMENAESATFDNFSSLEHSTKSRSALKILKVQFLRIYSSLEHSTKSWRAWKILKVPLLENIFEVPIINSRFALSTNTKQIIECAAARTSHTKVK